MVSGRARDLGFIVVYSCHCRGKAGECRGKADDTSVLVVSRPFFLTCDTHPFCLGTRSTRIRLSGHDDDYYGQIPDTEDDDEFEPGGEEDEDRKMSLRKLSSC